MTKPPSKEPASRQQIVAVGRQLVVGPLPDPNILAQYDQVVQGAAERIIAMAERDSMHLQTTEKMHLSAVFSERRRGQMFGFSIGVIGIVASVFLAMNGHEITASVIGGATVVGLVSVFVVGHLYRRPAQSKP